MKKLKLISMVLITGMMTGCVPPTARSGAASISSLDTTWEPAVDPHGDKNAASIKPDLMECKQLAEKAVGGRSIANSKCASSGGSARRAVELG